MSPAGFISDALFQQHTGQAMREIRISKSEVEEAIDSIGTIFAYLHANLIQADGCGGRES